jgi:hypothetical protein
MPAKAGIHLLALLWIPAFAGMTSMERGIALLRLHTGKAKIFSIHSMSCSGEFG